jgi:hypothetical protein
MLPSCSTTLLRLSDHPALAFTRVQGAVKFSSPKYHAQPVGLPVEASVNVTVNGDGPFMGVPVNCATGAAALVELTTSTRQTIIKQYRVLPIIINLSRYFRS